VGLIGSVLLLPLAPAKGLAWVVGVVNDEAQRELANRNDPGRRLEELAAMTANGEISPEEAARLEEELIDQILANDGPAAGP
jgi:hypothetical protein